jgi:hypothetical protein
MPCSCITVPGRAHRGWRALVSGVLLLALAMSVIGQGDGDGSQASAAVHARKCEKGQKRIRGKCRPKPKKISRFGAMITDAADQARLDRLRALGTSRVRLVARLDIAPNSRVADAQAQGFEVLTTATNGAFPADPPADVADYQARLGRELDAHPTALVSIENEPTADRYYTGAPEQYLAELAAAVPVAQAHGTKISDGGLVSAGVQLATWEDLWVHSGCAAADHYAAIAFPALRIGGQVISDVPSCADPNRPILGSNPKALQVLNDTNTLIAGFRSIPIDYVNFHWYQSTPEAMRTTIEFLRRATGKQAITNEIGQFDDSPDTLRGLLDMTAQMHLPWVVWFASDGSGAVGMFNADGSIRSNGLAFRDFVQRCDDRIDCGRDKRNRRKHGKHHR